MRLMVSSIVMRLLRGRCFMIDCFLGTALGSSVFYRIWSISSDLKEETEAVQPDPDTRLLLLAGILQG